MNAHELTKKVHGLPLYAWIGIGGGTLGFLFFYMKRKTSNATPVADSSTQDIPANSDSGTTYDTGGMPWSGGAPSSSGDGQYITDAFSNLSDQEQSDAASWRDSLAAAIKQEQDDNQARQSDLVNQNAQRLSDLQALSAQYQASLATGNAAATAVAQPKPQTPAQVAASTPQLGPGGTPAYLPPATIAKDSSKSTATKVGKVGNSGIHAA